MKALLSNIFTGLIFLLIFSGCQKSITGKTGTVKIIFKNMVGSSPMQLDGSTYTNPFGEDYTITKFKYYISNIGFGLSGPENSFIDKSHYYLVDQSDPTTQTISFSAEENNFTTVSFLIGVDSIRNVSGAQTGALDPLNDMFWTWNSGYIMAKMEGVSPQSGEAENLIAYHIGGFSGANNTLKTISLIFPANKILSIKQGSTSEITVAVDFSKWWQNPNDIKIVEHPVITTPGALAKQVADNYSNMFTVTDVVNK